MVNFPVVPRRTVNTVGWIGAWRAACMALVAEVVYFIVAGSALCAKTVRVNFKAAVAENAPTWEQKGVISRNHYTISTCEDCAGFSWAASRASTINASGLRTHNAFSLEHGVPINTRIACIFCLANTIILALLAMLHVEKVRRLTELKIPVDRDYDNRQEKQFVNHLTFWLYDFYL